MAEVVIYHVRNTTHIKPLPTTKRSGAKRHVSKVLLNLGRAAAFVGFVILVFYIVSTVYNNSLANYKLSNSEVTTLTHVSAATPVSTRYTPPFDPRLPLANHLAIPAIGVDTNILEATYADYESALKKGVWRVSDFGAPGDVGVPVILAAHRYGYLAWTNLYRRENSFFNLPNLKVGDTVEIDYQQRKYTYEIYADGKGPEIMDYTADLILYTCESLTGETRIFKYARLIKT